MLDDVIFVTDSININLYFLRTLREFCLTIQLSSLDDNEKDIQIAKEDRKSVV